MFYSTSNLNNNCMKNMNNMNNNYMKNINNMNNFNNLITLLILIT